MKNVNKKFTALIAMMLLALTLCACGQQGEETYGQYTRDDLYQASYSTWQMLDSMTFDEIAAYQMYYSQQNNGDPEYESAAALINDWAEVYPELGDFVSEKSFTVDKSGKTTTATLEMDYTGRDVQIVYVFNTFDMSVNAINIQPVYSLGELMSKAGMNVVMGMGTVFIILIVISLIIYAFNIIPYLTNKKKKSAPAAEASAEPAVAAAPAENLVDDGELVAVIAAAIAASTGAATDSFVVRQIRRRA